jgi:hypothetical protein
MKDDLELEYTGASSGPNVKCPKTSLRFGNVLQVQGTFI